MGLTLLVEQSLLFKIQLTQKTNKTAELTEIQTDLHVVVNGTGETGQEFVAKGFYYSDS